MSKNYDYIIVGGGPSGILTAYNIAKNRPYNNILILEKNEKTLEDYVNKDHDEIANWFSAQSDMDFQYSFQSEDEKSVWMGKGLGGGSLIFGLQYIDQDKLIKNHEYLKPYFKELEEIVKAERYNYENNEPNKNWKELYDNINKNKDENTLLMNNKVYGTNINNEKRKRVQLGDLLKDFKNITIEYGKSVKNINIKDKNADYLTTFDGIKYYAGKIIMCAGAIQTPAILQRSGIDCGNKLYDHAGFTLTYSKFKTISKEVTTTKQVPKTETVEKKEIEEYQGTKTLKLDRENIKLLNINNTDKYIYNVNGGPGDGKVYDFTSWVNRHPGGAYRIKKWTSNDYQLNWPSTHGLSRWNSGINSLKYIGIYNKEINYDKLPPNLQNKSIENKLFPSKEVVTSEEVTTYETVTSTETVTSDEKIEDLSFEPEKYIGHLQTRDNHLTWQTYYSTISFLKDSLILTYAQSTNLSGNGSVKIQNKEEDVNPIVTLNHFMDNKEDKLEENEDYINDLVDCFIVNHKLLLSNGYKLNDIPLPINENIPEQQLDILLDQLRDTLKNIVRQQANSIYHYHGSTAEIVDKYNKVNNTDNIYIGDISTFSKPWGGSTSVPAAANGLYTSKNIMIEEDKNNKILWKYSIDEDENTLVVIQINKLDKNKIYKLDFENNKLTYDVKVIEEVEIEEKEETITESYEVLRYYVKTIEEDGKTNFIFNSNLDDINKNIKEELILIPNNIYIIENLDDNNFNVGTDWKKNDSEVFIISNANNELKVNNASSINKNETIIFSLTENFKGNFYCFSYTNKEIINRFNIN
uniref:Glucose-methanol-choline oxidoreductase C-terminal domain-containing protein n=1 Tax=viral metagenome TaxID=1070528 RepID=A0A6C0AY76_9ZZZZ|tara:strand:+ start:8544 stop:10964 length:2421 start_codon:yes stop_codon:yes gene_type:complete